MIRMNFCHMGVCVPLLLCGTGIIFPTPSQAQTYTIVDLGTLGGTQSEALALNNLGQVVGASRPTGDGNWHAFLWSGGVMTDLHICGGTESAARGINDSGMIVGQANGIGGAAYSAFLIDSNGCTILPELSANTTLAGDINNSGVIVGWSNPAPQNRKAVRWVNQVLEQLSSPGQAVAVRVNSAGQISGWIGNELVATACLWSSGGVRTDLPGLGGGGFAAGHDISDSGWVVGETTNANAQQRAFLWTPAGGTVDLGTLGGSTGDAIAVNSSAV
jgi:probable HAF family extracellular repeat protein